MSIIRVTRARGGMQYRIVSEVGATLATCTDRALAERLWQVVEHYGRERSDDDGLTRPEQPAAATVDRGTPTR